MKRNRILSYLVLLSLLFCLPVFGQGNTSETLKGVLRVKIRPELTENFSALPRTRGGVVRTGITPFDNISQKVKAVTMKRVFPYAPKYEEKMRKHGLHLWYEIRYDKDITPEEAITMYKSVSGIENAEIIKKMVVVGNPRITESKEPAANAAPQADIPFNDPQIRRQWHYSNDGSIVDSKAGSDINLFEAWKITTGSRNILVAIIDGGVDYKHQDLAENMWINKAEANGKPGVDDDGNGYVDDVYGYNFVTGNSNIYPHRHGTHVAGTVAAVNNNNIGVAGVAGGSGNKDGVYMMSCQIFDTDGSDGYAPAIVYAANNGATIAQCSWGWPDPDYYEQAVLDAIDYFTEEAGNFQGSPMKGGLCIFAAGNTGTEALYYPQCYPKVLAVGAMDPAFKGTSYSTMGSWVDVTAPGGNIEFHESNGVYSTLPSDGYGYMEGTSMACPHVSGIAALILSKYGDKDYTNEQLRQRLLTSCRDFYVYNPQSVGKFGEGYIDALMALAKDGGKAPDAVSDLSLLASQEDITAEWTIPNDEDDPIVYNHIIYWSNHAFTAETDLTTLEHRNHSTPFQKIGTKVIEQISGVKPEAEYWVAIQAEDRWGHRSKLSEVKRIKTNSGPKVVYNPTNLALKFETNKQNLVKDSVTMLNSGEGMLHWEASLRTYNQSFAPYQQTSTAVPQMRASTPFSGRISTADNTPIPFAAADYVKEDYPIKFQYWDVVNLYIGDSDTTLSNSLGQWFIIDPAKYPDGFNLTHLRIEGRQSTGASIVQIYEGSNNINKKYLMVSDTIRDQSIFFTDLPLSEQLFFPAGSKLWVVVQTPRGNIRPLCTADIKSNAGKISSYSYYSSNHGKSWNLLSDILKEGNMADEAETQTWCVTLESKNPSWNEFLTLNPPMGDVKPQEKGKVELIVSDKKIINGTYNFNLYANTNENGKETVRIPVELKISGNKPALHSAKVVDFGKIYVGQKKDINVEIFNSGYGKFSNNNGSLFADNMQSSSDQFSVPGYSVGFEARATTSLKVTYEPTTAGSHSSVITLTDQNDLTHTFIVTGDAITPPSIGLDPEFIDADTLILGETPIQVTAQIKNTGGFPLEYVFPKFSDDTVSGLGKTSHKFGYSFISNLTNPDEFAYEWAEIPGAIDVKKQLNEQSPWIQSVNIGFSFPYFGENYDSLYICSYGALGIKTGPISCVIPSASSSCLADIGFITAFGLQQIETNAKSKILYGKQNGKFTVSFEDVLVFNIDNSGYIPVSFRIALCENGDIEIFYKDYQQYNIFSNENIFIGCTDLPVNDPFIVADADDQSDIHEKITSGTAIKIIAPGKNIITALDQPSGYVDINGSKTLTFTLAADSTMTAGPVSNLVTILSNDPQHSTSYLKINAVVAGEYYKSNIIFSKTELDFGRVFRTSTSKEVISLINNGKAGEKITALSLKDNKFTLSTQTVPFEVKAGNSVDIIVTVPTVQEGSVEDVLTVTTESGKTLTAKLKAEVTGVPDLTILPASLTEELASGNSREVNVQLTNTGNNTLEYSISSDAIFYPTEDKIGEMEEIEYICRSANDGDNVTYEWEDILETGERHSIEELLNSDYFTVALPFEVNFYGKAYTEMYVYGPGFITFNKYAAYGIWLDPQQIPNPGADIHNYLAPFWGYHSPSGTETSGVYYKAEDNRVIVSWIDYGNTLNLGICFQVIMYKNGKFKYQYSLLPGGNLYSLFGMAGFESDKGTKGTMLPSRYVSIGNSMELIPVKRQQLKAGENRKLKMAIDASSLMAGEYDVAATMSTNIPDKEEMDIKLNLTVTGKAKVEYPEKLDIGDLFQNSTPEMFYFDIKNVGTANFNVESIALEAGQDYNFNLSALVMAEDWETGQLTEQWLPFDSYMIQYPMTVGKKPLKLMLQNFYTQDLGSVADKITITTDLPEGNINIPVTFNVVEPPVMEVHQKEIMLYAAAKDYVFDSTFVINNTGNYKLDYNVTASYDEQYVAPEPETANVKAKGKLPAACFVKTATPFSTRAASAASTGEYIDTLEYENTGNIIGAIGTAEKYTSFIASTKYTAPEKGFNIAAIEFTCSVGELTNAEIKAEIRTGSSYFLNAKVIAEGSITVAKETEAGNAARSITFDNVYINPNETFYVFLYFPIGVPNPMGVLETTEKNVTNRYMAWVGSEWNDMAELEATQGYPVGFALKCFEKEAGTPWLTVTDQNSGIATANGEGKVLIHVNASTARYLKGNKATISITGNDPEKASYSFPVILDKNSAPVITLLDQSVSVKENEKAEIRFTIKDNEGDPFTVTLSDTLDITTVTTDQAKATVTLSPRFGDAGQQMFTLKATDTYQNQSTLPISYYVEKVNRTPFVVAPISRKDLRLGEVQEAIDLLSVFEDPDHDTLTYTAVSPDGEVVKALINGNTLELVLKATGETEITLTATDPFGLSATTSFIVNVLEAEKNSGNQQLQTWPNPVVYALNVRCSEDISGEATLRLYNMGGNLAYMEKTVITPGSAWIIDVTSFPAGIYILEIEHGNGKVSTKVIKQ